MKSTKSSAKTTTQSREDCDDYRTLIHTNYGVHSMERVSMYISTRVDHRDDGRKISKCWRKVHSRPRPRSPRNCRRRATVTPTYHLRDTYLPPTYTYLPP